MFTYVLLEHASHPHPSAVVGPLTSFIGPNIKNLAGVGVTCPYSVGVTVVEARGLKRSDIFTADPFAWLRLGGSSHKTKVRRSTR